MYSKQRFGVLNHPKISIDYLVKYLDEGGGEEKGAGNGQKEMSEILTKWFLRIGYLQLGFCLRANIHFLIGFSGWAIYQVS